MGAACAHNVSEAAQTGLQRYAARIGLAFQVVDDVLDCTSDTATLGKTAGKDAQADKPTYVALLGLSGAQDYARALHREALEGLAATIICVRLPMPWSNACIKSPRLLRICPLP